jgi:hypothetical protein
MAIQVGAWGHCQVDLDRGTAVAVVTPELAARPDLLNLCLLNTVLTNQFMAGGLAMLHATCLLRGERALLLMAPHNSGKSTTALRLVLGGYPLLSDSQVYLAAVAAPTGLRLLGFPVGRVKLRADVLPRFPHLHADMVPEEVRGETKYMLDLRQVEPALVCAQAIVPAAIDVCLLSRSADGRTRLAAAERGAAVEAAVRNSLHYHTEAVWQRNLELIAKLIDGARWHHLEAGSQPDELLAAVARLEA